MGSKGGMQRELLQDYMEKHGKFCFYCEHPITMSKSQKRMNRGVAGRLLNNIATLDHIVPKSKGGKTTVNNCVASCHYCNNRKGDKNALEYIREIQKLWKWKNRL